jgi:hypothetical protein
MRSSSRFAKCFFSPSPEAGTPRLAGGALPVVSGSYYLESGRLEVFVEITDARTGRVLLDLGPLRGPAARPDSVLAHARDRVVAFMRSR